MGRILVRFRNNFRIPSYLHSAIYVQGDFLCELRVSKLVFTGVIQIQKVNKHAHLTSLSRTKYMRISAKKWGDTEIAERGRSVCPQ